MRRDGTHCRICGALAPMMLTLIVAGFLLLHPNAVPTIAFEQFWNAEPLHVSAVRGAGPFDFGRQPNGRSQSGTQTGHGRLAFMITSIQRHIEIRTSLVGFSR